jgi:hypothetical protein
MSEVNRILSAIEQGDPHAGAELLPLVYEELRSLAAARLAQEKPGQTLQPTALVHEAYLRLVAGPAANSEPRSYTDRAHFFAVAATTRWANRQGLLVKLPEFDMPKGAKGMKGRRIAGEEFDRLVAAIPKGLACAPTRRASTT